jgi:cell fate (sporulation/competence/biofilm development) regulator YlbF (YheA/YmcA/DUF963 family)|tara:strand:+ start:188 stop:793 length:606 start_codon:yes stop_codon:yes gene_type:complete
MTKNNDIIKMSDKSKKYWTDRITNLSKEKARELNRWVNDQIDKTINKELSSFTKTCKLDKHVKANKKAHDEYEEFMKSKTEKERKLEENRNKSARDLVDAYNRYAKIQNWSSIYDNETDHEDIMRTIKNTCREELKEKIKKTTSNGQLLLKMDEQQQKMLDTIHHPKLTFKTVDFATAISKGFSAMGISYQVNDEQIKQLN